MKTIIGTVLALGLLSTSASAWYCPPGSSSSHGQRTYSQKSYQKPTSSKVAAKAQAAPAAPIESVPAPAPEPQK